MSADSSPSPAASGRMDDLVWIVDGIERRPRVVLVALLAAWTWAWAAIWVATILAVITAVVGLTAGSIFLGQAGGLAGGAAGLALGFGLGLALVYGTSLLLIAKTALISVLGGLCFAWVLTWLRMYIEPWELEHLYGYRRLSRREASRITPLLDEVADAMELDYLPRVLMKDDATPAAWAHTRHLVLTTGLLGEPAGQLAGILAHELHHWRRGDPIAATFVMSAALPLALMAMLGAWLRDSHNRGVVILAAVGLILLWPAWLLNHLITIANASEGRRQEYEADATAARLGYGRGLAEALETLRVFEPAREGWEQVLHAEHPPTELRIDRLEQLMETLPPDHLVETWPASAIPGGGGDVTPHHRQQVPQLPSYTHHLSLPPPPPESDEGSG